MSTFTDDEIRTQLRAQKIPEHMVERAVTANQAGRYVRSADVRAMQVADASLEKHVVAAADKQLRALGFIVVNFSQPRATKQTAGIPDRRFYHVGRRICFWWEAKAPGGHQSPAQREFQDWCEMTGDGYALGTDQDLYRWLVARYPLRWDESGNLVWIP